VKSFDTRTLSQRVYSHLTSEILSNRLAPGTHLHEAAIAASLNISRVPVREALRLLAAEGLVTIMPRRGAVVKALSPQEFLAAYQVREVLEALAIRLAVPRMSAEDLRTLRALHRQMVEFAERDDVDRYFRANAAFHGLLIERSGNRHLQDIYHRLMNQTRRYRMRSLYLRGGLRRSLSEHAAILEAVERRDAEAAARLLGEHIQVPQRILQASRGVELIEAIPSRSGERDRADQTSAAPPERLRG